MNESQIIDDILNQLYDYDTILNSRDGDLIKKKKREKNEKQEELITQIDLTCSILEKELRSELGEAFYNIKKGLRAFVIDSIQKEVKNGNKVVGADGKFSLKKFSTTLLNQKSEIIKNITAENDRKTIIDGYEIDSYKTSEDQVSEYLKDLGMEMSEDEEKTAKEAFEKTKTIIDDYQELINSGKSPEEALHILFGECSQEELMLLSEQFEFVKNIIEIEKNKHKDKGESTGQTEMGVDGEKSQNVVAESTTTETKESEENKQSNLTENGKTTTRTFIPQFNDYNIEEFNNIFEQVYKGIQAAKAQYVQSSNMENPSLLNDKDQNDYHNDDFGPNKEKSNGSILLERSKSFEEYNRTKNLNRKLEEYLYKKRGDISQNIDIFKEQQSRVRTSVPDISAMMDKSKMLSKVKSVQDKEYVNSKNMSVVDININMSFLREKRESMLSPATMKGVVINTAQESKIKNAAEDLMEMIKTGIIPETLKDTEVQETTEPQTPESGPGEPDDEVK